MGYRTSAEYLTEIITITLEHQDRCIRRHQADLLCFCALKYVGYILIGRPIIKSIRSRWQPIAGETHYKMLYDINIVVKISDQIAKRRGKRRS